MKIIFLSLFFAGLLLGSFYLGYIFAIDIFELGCFRTSDEKFFFDKFLKIE